MAATDAQVQAFVDQRLRPRCEAYRALMASIQDDQNAISDVYAAVTEQNPTWTDNRTDGPPHLLTPSDVAALNTIEAVLLKVNAGTATTADVTNMFGQLPILEKACVRPLGT